MEMLKRLNKKQIITIVIVVIIVLSCLISSLYALIPMYKELQSQQLQHKTTSIPNTNIPISTFQFVNTSIPRTNTPEPNQPTTNPFPVLPRQEISDIDAFIDIKKVYIDMRNECQSTVDDPDTCPGEEWPEYIKTLIGKRVRWTGWVNEQGAFYYKTTKLPESTIKIDMDDPLDKTDAIKTLTVFLVSDNNLINFAFEQKITFEGTISHIDINLTSWNNGVILTDIVIID